MRKSKLIQILSVLEAGEWDALEDFLRSPYFNRDEDVLRLFEVLRSLQPGFADTVPGKERLYAALFPGKAYDDKAWRYLSSRLNKLVEHFLAWQQLAADPFALTFAGLEALSVRGLGKAYEQISRQLARDWPAVAGQGSRHFRARLRWAEIREQHFERRRERRFDESIQEVTDYLDRYYYLERLRLACAMLDRQSVVRSEYQTGISREWIAHLQAQGYFGTPLIRLYFTIYQALREEAAEEHFRELKRQMSDAVHNIAARELRDVYLFAINYCARKIRQGRTAYTREAWELYREGIETGVLLEDGLLSPWAFTNVVKLSLRLEAYDWVEPFIAEYASRLPEAFRQNAVRYNQAELYYATQRLQAAQELLQQVEFTDLNYFLGARVLLARIYYELGEEEPLLSLLASFTIFLKRNKKISNSLKLSCLHFCQFLFQIVRRSPSRMQRLAEEMQQTPLLAEREWLGKIHQAV